MLDDVGDERVYRKWIDISIQNPTTTFNAETAEFAEKRLALRARRVLRLPS
jgi:hypothetical protein